LSEGSTGLPTQEFRVTGAFRGVRLDRFVQAMIPRMSRSAVHGALRAGRIELGSGVEPKPARRLVPGDCVVVRPRDGGEWAPVELGVLLDGDGWRVLDKPAGLPSQPTARHAGRDVATLTGWFPAHRLDRFTSGCLLVTRGGAVARHFAGVLSGEAVKTYAAIVRGRPEWDRLTVRRPLGPAVDSRVPGRMTVAAPEAPEARRAETTFELVAPRGEGAATRTLLHATLGTGRRHQVRVHAASIGHPIVGDLLYGGDERLFVRHQLGQHVEPEDGVEPGRVLLHARCLEFADPSGDWQRAVAPWPEDFPRELTDEWGAHSAG
jgi:23S rRNA pseudouridine1911/1915/1917 synthase